MQPDGMLQQSVESLAQHLKAESIVSLQLFTDEGKRNYAAEHTHLIQFSIGLASWPQSVQDECS